VVDGDTLLLSGGTKGKRVRLIGIDAPESADPRQPVGCFGREAAQRMFTLLPPGTPVRLVYDVELADRFGRTLAYVYRRPDGLFVNAALVEEGYAAAATHPPNVVHADEFVALARQAREAGTGLWGACQEAPAGP
jgi:endonuclease YncB( thermonuclease family)